MAPCHSITRARRGFTLVELMAVVVITGILATVGIGMLITQLRVARSAEAPQMIQSIRAAQERWFADNMSYASPSSAMNQWYPMATPGTHKYAWGQPSHNRYNHWMMLNVTVPGPVQFGYASMGGGVGDTVPTLNTKSQPAWSAPLTPWYVIQARGDLDGDASTFSTYAASSFSPEVYVEDLGY